MSSQPDSNPDRWPDTFSHADSDAYRLAERRTYADCDADGKSDCHSDTDSDPDAGRPVRSFLRVRPAPFNFGTVKVANTRSQTFSLANRPLPNSKDSITNPGYQCSDCRWVLVGQHQLSGVVAPNKVCSVTVSFSPTPTGLVSDFMMINNNPATARCE